MNLETLLLGAKIYAAIAGGAYTVPSAGTIGQESKPGALDASWINYGHIGEVTVKDSGGDAIEIWEPSPGQVRRTDIIFVKRKIDLSFVARKVQPQAIQAMLGTLNLTGASTQFNPLEGKTIKCWLKLQAYDQNDAVRLTLDHFGVLKCGDVKFDPLVETTIPWEFMGLHSTLNTGSIV